MYTEKTALRGAEVLSSLAQIYPQLYLSPGPESAEAYRRIVLQGQEAPSRSLAHFSTHPEDSLVWEKTPAGVVPVITLTAREDFELFVQIMAHRCSPVPIPRTQGASTLDGVINWTKIRAHKEEYLLANGPEADWEREFERFTADKANYTDALIVLSVGPYSAVSAEKAGMPEGEWLSASHTIRKIHECTHFLCRRLFPELKDAVWDELVADATGIAAAFGRFDPALEELFLGIDATAYTGGRLGNYVEEEDRRQERLDALARKIHGILPRMAAVVDGCRGKGIYEPAIRLEEEIGCWKQP